MNSNDDFDPFKDVLNQKEEEKKNDYFGKNEIIDEQPKKISFIHKCIIFLSIVVFVLLICLIFIYVRSIYD